MPNSFPAHFYAIYEIDIQLVNKIFLKYFLGCVSEGRSFGWGVVSS